MSDKNFYNMMGFAMTLSIANGKTIRDSEEYDRCIFSIAMGIDDLIEAGYTKEEIKDLIMETDPTTKYPTLTKEDVKSLRIEALEILDSKYDQYIDQMNNQNFTTINDEHKIKKFKK